MDIMKISSKIFFSSFHANILAWMSKAKITHRYPRSRATRLANQSKFNLDVR